MILFNDNVKVKRGDQELVGTLESKAVDLQHGTIYDAAQMLQVPEEWSWVGASLIYKEEPPNFEVLVNGDQVDYTSRFDGVAVVTVNYYPAEKRFYIAVEKKEGADDFGAGLHELVVISFQLVGYRLFIEIRERQ